MPAGPPFAPSPDVGPDQMGLLGADGDERGVGGRGHPRQLRRLQQGLHGVHPVPVVVVGAPVASDIRTTGLSVLYVGLFSENCSCHKWS